MTVTSLKCFRALCVSAQSFSEPNATFGKGQILLRYPGRRQVRGWSQTCSELEFGLSSSELARASRSATSFGPVCDQDSVIEFGLDQLRTGLQPGSSYLDMLR